MEKEIPPTGADAPEAYIAKLDEYIQLEADTFKAYVDKIRPFLSAARDLSMAVMDTTSVPGMIQKTFTLDDATDAIEVRVKTTTSRTNLDALQKRLDQVTWAPPAPAPAAATSSPPATSQASGEEDDKPKAGAAEGTEPEEGGAGDPPKEIEETTVYAARVHKRFVVDFSTGIAQSWLRDRSYSVGPPAGYPDTTPLRVIRENPGGDAVNPGTVVFAHFYPTSLFHTQKNSFLPQSIGLSMGLPLGSSGGAFNRLLIGPTLVWGRKNRIMLTVGMDLNKVQRLSGGDVVGQPPLQTSGPQTSKVYRRGAFVALSFALNFAGGGGNGNAATPPKEPAPADPSADQKAKSSGDKS
ncbi:MAG: hypothetical protein QM758_02645 [Armatimonas sp.]